MMFITTIILLTLQSIHANPNFIQQNLSSTGIFFEKLNDALFFTNQINIITTINLPKTDDLTSTLLNCNEHLKSLCDEILDKNPADLCKPFRRELKWHIGQIEKQNTKLNEMYGRSKRGLIDIGGKFSKFLFGTMDSEDSQNVYDNLQTLENGQAKLLALENQHIAVLKSNFDALSKPITQLQNETEEIQFKLNQLIQKSNDQHEFFDRKSILNQQVTELMSLMLIQCLHINKIQEEASEIIASLRNKNLHPLITSYDKLTTILKNSTNNLNDKIFHHDILRQITETQFTEINGKIIIKIIIPLIEQEEYTIHKPYLIPHITPNGYATYLTNIEYLAVNLAKSKIIELKLNDLTKGKTITDHLYTELIILKHTQPILLNQNSHCILQLLNNPLSKASGCNSIPARPINTFIKLENKNSWLYSLIKPTNLIISCGKNSSNLLLSKEGLLTFLTKCKVITKDFIAEVAGHPKTVQLEQPQTIQFSNEQINFDYANYTRSTPKLQLIEYKNHNQDFTEEQKKIHELHATSSNINLQGHRKNFTNETTISTVTIIIVILIIIIITVVYKRKRTATKLTMNTINIPEKQTSNSMPATQGIRVI